MQRKPDLEPDDERKQSGSPKSQADEDAVAEKSEQPFSWRPDHDDAEQNSRNLTCSNKSDDSTTLVSSQDGKTEQPDSEPHGYSSRTLERTMNSSSDAGLILAGDVRRDANRASNADDVHHPPNIPVGLPGPTERRDRLRGNVELRFLEENSLHTNPDPMAQHLLARAVAAVDAARDSLAAAALAVDAAATAVTIALRASEPVEIGHTAPEVDQSQQESTNRAVLEGGPEADVSSGGESKAEDSC